MIRHRIEGLYHLHAAGLILVQTLAFWGLFLGLQSVVPDYEINAISRYAVYNVAGIFGFIVYLFQSDSSRLNLLALDPIDNLRITARQTAFIGLAIVLLLVATKDRSLSRLFLFCYLPTVYVALYLANQGLPGIASRLLFLGRNKSQTLLVGPARQVKRLNRWLRYSLPYGVTVTGILTKGVVGKKTCGFPILGNVEELGSILRETQVDQVIVLEIPKSPELVSELIQVTDRVGARLLVIDDTSERFRHPVIQFHHLGVDFITLREEPLQDPANRILKRLVDVCISLPVVLVILPILAIVVRIWQRIYSPGPLFYRQIRSGVQRQPFEILKFRTMHVQNDDASRQATSNDPRIFRGGRFLRRTSLDEFPQFLNVLRGEMSVVGPRPHMLEHDAQFAEVMSAYHVRGYVKPGITGLAQVRGFRGEARSDEDIHRRALADIEYIERWSLSLDFLIILRTALHVIRPPKTAY